MVLTVPKTVWKFLVVQKIIEISLLQFIDKVLPYVVAQRQIPTALRGPRQFFMPVACRQFWGPDVQKTVVLRSCSSGQSGHARCCDDRCMDVQFSNMVDMPCVATTGAFGFTVQKIVKVPQLQCLSMFAVQFPRFFYGGYGGDEYGGLVWGGRGFFGGIDAIFRAPPVSF